MYSPKLTALLRRHFHQGVCPDASKINYLSADWTQADDADAKIKGINVSQLAGLKELILDNNNIGSLDISKCVALTTLRASDNRLTSLTFW